jgi:Concanavalin A-like lectin/glucanases superfamily
MARSVSTARIQNRSFGTSLSFNGTSSDYLTCPYALAGGTTGFSIAFWLYVPQFTSGTYGRVFDYMDGSNKGTRFILNGDSNPFVEFDCGNGSLAGLQFVIPRGAWTHLGLIYNNGSTNVTAYVNANLYTSTYAAYSAPTGQTFTLGKQSNAASGYGLFLVKDFTISDNYNYTQSDIYGLYTAGTMPTGAKVFYNFNSNVNDSSGNGNNATKTGTSYSTNVISVARTSLI